MQIGPIGDPISLDTWSDAEVDQALAYMESIEASQVKMEQQIELNIILIQSALVIITALFAWHAIGPFFPSSRQFIGKD